jgi:hypothetical protein
LLSVAGVLSGTLYVVACGGSSAKPDSGVKLQPDAAVDAKPCAAKATYGTPSFGSAQVAEDFGSGSGITEDLLWQGGLGSDAFISMEMVSGGGSNTPDWPTGNISAKSDIDIVTAENTDMLMFVGTNINGSGIAQDLYLAMSGTLNVTSAGGVGSNFAATTNAISFQHCDSTGQGFSCPAAADSCMSAVDGLTMNVNITMGSAGSAIVPGTWHVEAGRLVPE